jgi:membrane-associated phospholipid phosphatase
MSLVASDPPVPPQPHLAASRPRTLWHADLIALPLTMVLLGSLSLVLFDHPVGAYFSVTPAKKLGRDLDDFLSAAEHFGTPWGQILALFAVGCALRWREPRFVRIFIGAGVAGLAANVGKLCIARQRPRMFDFDLPIAESFSGLLTWGAGGSGMQSFPSAHTACAFGFACLLTWAWPSGRVAFLTLAFLTGLERIATSAHYPSDVFFGAALGWLVGMAFIGSNPLAAAFDRFETRWRLRFSADAK